MYALDSKKPIAISALIPVGRRHSQIAELYKDYKAGLQALGAPYECIFILDGPYPAIANELQRLVKEGEDIAIVQLTRSFGEAAALMAGFERAAGQIIVTLPAYHQIEAADIGRLVAAVDKVDMAIGRRWPRAGGPLEMARRWAFHSLLGWMTGLRFRDLGCGARAMRRQVLDEVRPYGDQHRFLAILADRLGFRVSEIEVRQSARDRFEGHYHAREYAHQILDIFNVFFLVRFTKRPLRFFGTAGAVMFGLGVLTIVVLVGERLIFQEALGDRPSLLLASLMMVMGMQLFALGLLGELIIFTHARDIKDYRIEQVVQFREPVDSTPADPRPSPSLVPATAAGNKAAG